MKRFRVLAVIIMTIMVLTACQSGAGSNDIALKEIEAVATESAESVEEVSEVVESTTEDTVSTEETSTDVAEVDAEAIEETEVNSEEVSEEVAKFPVRNEKIPPYEMTLTDGSTIKLSDYEGKVVVMTFFTTW